MRKLWKAANGNGQYQFEHESPVGAVAGQRRWSSERFVVVGTPGGTGRLPEPRGCTAPIGPPRCPVLSVGSPWVIFCRTLSAIWTFLRVDIGTGASRNRPGHCAPIDPTPPEGRLRDVTVHGYVMLGSAGRAPPGSRSIPIEPIKGRRPVPSCPLLPGAGSEG